MEGESLQELKKHVRGYWIVFGTLLVLTAISVRIAYFHLPIHYAILIAMIVATTKGTLVAGYFMHLFSEKKLIIGVLALTMFFFVVLMVIPALVDVEALDRAMRFTSGT